MSVSYEKGSLAHVTSDTAYHLASTGTLLLRLSLIERYVPLESNICELDIATESLDLVKSLISFLRVARDTHGWDLGEVCLSQCEPYLMRRLQQHRRPEQRQRQPSQSCAISSAGVEDPVETGVDPPCSIPRVHPTAISNSTSQGSAEQTFSNAGTQRETGIVEAMTEKGSVFATSEQQTLEENPMDWTNPGLDNYGLFPDLWDWDLFADSRTEFQLQDP